MKENTEAFLLCFIVQLEDRTISITRVVFVIQKIAVE